MIRSYPTRTKFYEIAFHFLLWSTQEKVRLSFTSGNYSFTECVRKDVISSAFSSSNSACTTECRNINFITQTKALSSAASYSFTNCSWNGCLSEPAGAISCSKSGASLAVINCKFSNCNSTSGITATKDYNGGAICAIGLTSLIVSSSLFYNCRAPQTNHNDRGSGGIYVLSPKNVFSLSSSDFISCFTGSSGAGIFFYSSSNPKLAIEIIKDCRYIQCRSQDQSPDGGGMCLWESLYTLRCIGCLFSLCTTTGSGGGMQYLFSANAELYPIKFCFFASNTGYNGNDISFSAFGSEFPCCYCFSTTRQNRVGYYDGQNWHTMDFPWLPKGIPKFV